jgi:BlaI family transcriptional regulator, penicillinase repressor
MAKSDHRQPTKAEVDVLGVLWRRGASTVRQVHEELGGAARVRYTTVLKILQNMHEKGLVARDEARQAHLYRAACVAKVTQRRLVRELLDRVFDGSAQQLVLQALSARRPSAEELAEIRRTLDELEER